MTVAAAAPPATDDLDAFVASHPAVKQQASAQGDDLDAFVAQHPAAQASQEWTGSSGIIPPSPEPPPSWSELPGNILPSAGRLVTGIGNAVTHPVETARGMAGVALGGLERGATKIGNAFSTPLPASPETAAEAQSESEPHAQYFDAFVKTLQERYGSLDNARATAIRDPVGFAADVSAIFSGGAKALGMASDLATAGNATRLARSLAATADVTRTASEWIDPVQNALRVAVPVAKGVGKVGATVLGASTGKGAEAINEAARNSPTFRDYMRGKYDAHDLLDKVREGVQDLKDARSAEYRAQLAALPTNAPLDLTALKNDVPDILKQFGVKFSAQGSKVKLNFKRSTISSSAEQAKVQQLVNDVYGWGKMPGDLDPLGVDTLKRRIGDMYNESGQARALVKNIEGRVKDVLSTVPGYEDMTRGYNTATEMVRQIERELGLKNMNPAVSLNRLSASFHRTTEFRKTLLDALSDSGKHFDFNAARAGMNLNNLAPEGLRGIFDVAAILGSAMSRGEVPMKDLMYLSITSPRLVGESMVLLANLRKGIAPVAGALRQPAAYRGMQYGNSADEQATQPSLGPPPFEPGHERGLQQVMHDHGLDRNTAIDKLRSMGLLPQ